MKVVIPTLPVRKIRYLRFYYYHWVDTSTGGLVIPGGIYVTGLIHLLVD